MQKRYVSAGLISILLIVGSGSWYLHKHSTFPSTLAQHINPKLPPKFTSKPVQNQAPKPVQPAHRFDSTQYSIMDAASLWVVVNKHLPLNPLDYTPSDLIVPDIAKRNNITSDEQQVRAETAVALKDMFAAATGSNVTLNLQSGYRSYGLQTTVYNRYVNQQGKTVADSQSARPGHSEHQSGLAADIGGTTQPSCNVGACFAETTEGRWLATHAYKFGFVIRYPAEKRATTGYIYEPWHVRYIGTTLATELHNKNISTLEEFFKLGDAADYN